MFSKILLIVLLLLPLEVSLQKVYTSRGKLYDKVQQRSRKPIEVIDTITVAGQWASMSLRAAFKKGAHSVAASSASRVFATITQLSTDSTDAVRSYSYIVKDRGKRLLIKASNNTDTTLVVVRAWIM